MSRRGKTLLNDGGICCQGIKGQILTKASMKVDLLCVALFSVIYNCDSVNLCDSRFLNSHVSVKFRNQTA